MKNPTNFRAFFNLFVTCCLILSANLFSSTVWAQSNIDPTSCGELQDEGSKFQMEICSSHVGCKLVLKIHDSCVKAKKFFTKLSDAIGEGTKTLFGRKKEVTPEALWEANLPDSIKKIETRPEWKEPIDAAVKEIKSGAKNFKEGANAKGSKWAYYGEITEDKFNGAGTLYFEDGQMHRGTFKDDKLNGAGDQVFQTGGRNTGVYLNGKQEGAGIYLTRRGFQYKGEMRNDKRDGNGVFTAPDGRRWEGSFSNDQISEGSFYYPNGVLGSKGTWENGELSVGQQYDLAGKPTEVVNKPRDREMAAVAAREKEALAKQQKEAQLLADAQRRKDAQAKADQAYRDSLNTMNAGQLFAKADELSSGGDKARAREVLRTLVSRFPDHALAAAAAQQMAGASNTSGSTGGAGLSAGSSGNAQSGSGGSGGNCDALQAKQEREFTAINRRPLPEGATPGLRRVMWMTSQAIKLLKESCPDNVKNRQTIVEYQQAYDQSAKACEQMTTGGACSPNAY